MEYPIFNSFVKRIQSELVKRNIKTTAFSKWSDKVLNATGLEIQIDLKPMSKYMKDISINFDWDSFRETALARKLPGLEKHPLYSKGTVSAHLEPTIDVEVSWNLEPSAFFTQLEKSTGDVRVDAASRWMEYINRQLTESFPVDDTITRWHIEIEGDAQGRYLSVMSLISYHSLSFSETTELNQILHLITKLLQKILIRTNKVIQISEQSAEQAA